MCNTSHCQNKGDPPRCQKSLFHICYGHSFSVAISHPLQSVIHNICWGRRTPFFVTKSGKWKHCKAEFVNELKCDISNEKHFKWCLNVLWLWPQWNVCSSQPPYPNWQPRINCFETSKVNSNLCVISAAKTSNLKTQNSKPPNLQTSNLKNLKG